MFLVKTSPAMIVMTIIITIAMLAANVTDIIKVTDDKMIRIKTKLIETFAVIAITAFIVLIAIIFCGISYVSDITQKDYDKFLEVKHQTEEWKRIGFEYSDPTPTIDEWNNWLLTYQRMVKGKENEWWYETLPDGFVNETPIEF